MLENRIAENTGKNEFPGKGTASFLAEEQIRALQVRVWVFSLIISVFAMSFGFLTLNLAAWGVFSGTLIGMLGFQMLVFTVTALGQPGKGSYGKAFAASGFKVAGMVLLILLFHRFGAGLIQMGVGLLISQLSIFLGILTTWEKPKLQTTDRPCTL